MFVCDAYCENMWKDIFSKAEWINKRRLIAYPRIFVTMYAIAIVIVLAMSHNLIDPLGKNIGTDFMTVWSAGKMAQQGRAAEVYDYQKHYEVQRAALPWKDNQRIPYYGWFYPPLFLIVALALACLSYGVALALWMCLTLPAYLAAVRAILPERGTVMAALAFPGVFVNLGHGQNGFLTAALLGGGLVLLQKRPYLAGCLFGLLAYKPQFGVLMPLALLAGGYWRTILSAAVTVVVEIAVSYALFGAATWQAFFESAKQTQKVALEQGAVGWERIQSLFAAVRMLGGSVELAYSLHILCAASAAAVVIWMWRRPAVAPELKSAALVTASLLATPYILDYDLVALALPIAWLTAMGLREGFRPWEKTILLLVWLLPLFSRLIAKAVHVPSATLIMGLLLLFIIRRAAEAKTLPSSRAPQ